MGSGQFATYVLLCQEEYIEWNGVHIKLQLGLGKLTGSKQFACVGQLIVMVILRKKERRKEKFRRE